MSNSHSEPLTFPSGDCVPVLEILCALSDISDHFGIEFERRNNDLDWFYDAIVNIEPYGPVEFLKYDNLPTGGIIVYIDKQVATNNLELDGFINDLGINRTWVIWQSTLEY